MNSEKSKTNEPQNPNKNMALANLSIYYSWKNIKTEYNNNKFKRSSQTWNETFEFLFYC